MLAVLIYFWQVLLEGLRALVQLRANSGDADGALQLLHSYQEALAGMGAGQVEALRLTLEAVLALPSFARAQGELQSIISGLPVGLPRPSSFANHCAAGQTNRVFGLCCALIGMQRPGRVCARCAGGVRER